MHYYQHHIGDFIKATARLTDTQCMTYLRLLWMYYDTEKPIKNDLRTLAFQLSVTENDVDLILCSFFKLENDQWVHSRCEQEISEYKAFIEKKSRGGKASAQQRLNASSAGDEQVLNDCSAGVQLTNNHKPITNKKTNTTLSRPDDVPEDLWIEFKQHRKNKKATITDRVIKTLRTEAAKANLSLSQVMEKMIVKGWTGFEANWIKPNETSSTEWWMNDRRVK